MSDDADEEAPAAGTPFPGRAEFAQSLGVPDGKAVGLLRVLLARIRPDATLPELGTLFEHLGRFVVAGPSPGQLPASFVGSASRARFELLVSALERVPAARARVAGCLGAILRQTSAVRLLAVVGQPNDRGLWAEATDRLAARFLPAPPDHRDLAALTARVVRGHHDYDWLGAECEPLLDRFEAVMGDAWAPMREAAIDAIGLITTRIGALGLGENLRPWQDHASLRSSPFYQLARAPLDELPPLVAACRVELARIRGHLEDQGVSVDVVYSIDAIDRGLTRIQRLLPMAGGDSTAETTRGLLVVLGRGLVGERSFRQLVADNMRLLARKVIERAGRTGEHYVTTSRREYWHMLSTAAGGGVVTAGTAIGKFLVKWGHFPLFIDGVFSSLLYAGSFLLIQFLGFTLATKQPSMTAAALAGTIRDRAGPDRLADLVALIARISRSQFAAAVGNVATVILVMALFDQLWKLSTGGPFLDTATATAVVKSFDPLRSGTVLFAAYTGVLLWMSSLVAGWFENWVVYRRIPEGLEHHRLGKRLGPARMARLARGVERQAAGVGGSVALGFFLGMTTPLAKFFGLPLDVRHVTLSAGSLALALSSLSVDDIGWAAIGRAWAGIAVIGLCNFGVSFALALVVAMRARDVPTGERRTLPWAVLRRFFRRPHEFFWPPKDPVGAPPRAPTAH
ncbi:MAG: gliding motility protein [Kofleriaceae bacterium]|nr:gliding motility protein [Kofleriaceae bacterium]MBP6836185.1 gliding motility protein [Kofleriaceae bacterium]MBP9206361.1 gliding motility protein [Kofleriaceae bacterium]